VGATIILGAHSAFNIPRSSTHVIHTAAVSKTNPEFKEAKRRKIPLKNYAEAVGDITRQFKTITVSGSHGKSTTTAMTSLVLEEGYCDPTVIIGTKMREFGDSNFRAGKGSHLVLEADEWNRSFLNYSPEIAAITNIDTEHLDTYKTPEAVESAFAEYLARVPKHGAIIANKDDDRAWRVAKKFGDKVVWYSTGSRDGKAVKKILRVPGEHNLSNALAALSIGRRLGIPEAAIMVALSRFTGTWRRFEFKGVLNDAFLFNDYGHHPREITATLAAARERFPLRRIWCVYQPHQHQRLRYLWDDFLTAFDMADRVTLLPVYDVAGRETKSAQKAVNSERLVRELKDKGKNVSHAASFDDAALLIRTEIRPGDAVLLMGAGDIYSLNKKLIPEN
ncbi:MAG: UDP-N-acetylmuramate--L-alanine ligase, partial [Candidatus Sungbacteria bacterium]|nr:UDP-N-acetylmuramate--L-alanine ligase [Candidatus Sungbacteria bacterium]